MYVQHVCMVSTTMNNVCSRVIRAAACLAALALLLLVGTVALKAQVPLFPSVVPDSLGKLPPVRILFIGNSYTFYNDMPRQLQEIAASMGDERTIITERVVKGGRALREHWNDTLALAAIRRGGWDLVVLQEHSLGALNAPDTMRKYIRLFTEEIRKVGAVPVLYMTWARQYNPKSQDSISRVYTRIGREFGAVVAPVGLAWQRVRHEYPAIVLFDPDGTHPSGEGSYLAACVFYAVFSARCPFGAEFNICAERDSTPVQLVNMVYSEADILQRIAWETYLEYTYSP